MWSTVAAGWVMFVGGIGALERAHVARVAEAAKGIQVGATKDDVLQVLGRPMDTYEQRDGWSILGIASGRSQWLYGSTINTKKLFVSDVYVMAMPLPINIRLFSYDDDDLVVYWDSKGRVSKVVIPSIPVDHRADKVLDSMYELHRIYSEVCSRSRKDSR